MNQSTIFKESFPENLNEDIFQVDKCPSDVGLLSLLLDKSFTSVQAIAHSTKKINRKSDQKLWNDLTDFKFICC